MDELAFYCVCDREHFPGLVALVNSLRVLGHDEPVYVLDCGFEPWQRDTLRLDPKVVAVSDESSLHPMLVKATLPLARPARTMVVVDVDIIFTARLDGLVETATRTGKPILFPDTWGDRFEPAWERLGYGPPVPHPYVASGQFVLPVQSGVEFLRVWEEGLLRFAADSSLSRSGLAPEADPFRFPDMDVLNAMIGTAIPLDSFVLADVAAAAYPPFAGMRIVDRERLAVEAADGSRPLLLHHFLGKPWNALVAPSPYSRLMTRLLCEDDVALRLPRRRVAPSLQAGPVGAIARRYVVARLATRGKLGLTRRISSGRLALQRRLVHSQ